MKYDILIKNTSYLTPEYTINENVNIYIKDGVISKIEKNLLNECEIENVVDGSSLLWMPGLSDGHIHTSQQLLKGRLLDEKPVIWKRVNVPFESNLNEELSVLSAQLAAYEMISNGTTSFIDAGNKYPELIAKVYENAGLKGFVSVMTNDNPHFPESLRAMTVNQGVDRLREMKNNISGNIKPIYSVTAPTACSEDLMKAVMLAAKEDGVPFETHMNEYASEVTDFMEKYEDRPFIWMEKNGLLGSEMVAPHCIFLSEDEMDIIKEHNISVVHCPFSNCGKGIPDTPELLRKGIKVSFGSDGAAHGGLDIFREVRLFRSLMQVSHGVGRADSSVMPAETLLSLATAHASGIAAGSCADIIAVNLDSPNVWPSQNLVHTLAESTSGSDVLHSIINGKLVMKNREVLGLDFTEIKAKAKEAFNKYTWSNNW